MRLIAPSFLGTAWHPGFALALIKEKTVNVTIGLSYAVVDKLEDILFFIVVFKVSKFHPFYC